MMTILVIHRNNISLKSRSKRTQILEEKNNTHLKFFLSISNAFYFAFLSWHFAAGDVVICRAADGDAALRGFLRAQEDDSQEGATYQAGQQELL